ncbi:interaptin isoform X3 [Drosophila takahashii]|uniref:interaptin isoform X3 n=1 Tax=Drosophila takahashii TaxID=29030 RepID=UPI0038991226
MDSASNIVEEVVETKNGTQEVQAGVIQSAPKDNNTSVEKTLDSSIDNDEDKLDSPKDGDEDADLISEESESDDDEKTKSDVAVTVAPVDKPQIPIGSSDVDNTTQIDEGTQLESEKTSGNDVSIKADPPITPEASIPSDIPPTVSEENPRVDVQDDNTIGTSISTAGTASVQQDTSNILIDGDEAQRTEDVALKDQSESLTEKGTELKERGKRTIENKDAKLSQENDFNNQILDIISDIDINIKAQEKITQLKEQELKLIQKQNELASQIQQQQILAQQLNAQNKFKQSQCQSDRIESKGQQQNDVLTCKESTNISKTVDLRKIFTPATDATEILPKNRKLYASSAFYSPTLHPTVEDQVELARRISHSLSDISNQTSKGQSMYVNRKKRSDKWVHEGRSPGNECSNDAINPYKENSESNSTLELTKLEKIPLKLIMNPNGKVRDYNSLKELINVETGLLSPDNCAELITALQLHQGRGAELFAKRRRKADNWIVDETHSGTQNPPSGIPDYQQYQQRPVISPNILPAYSDAGKHRVQLNIHQNQLIEKYSKPGVQVVQSPWEAALQTGSASSAFVEDKDTKGQSVSPAAASPAPYFQSGRKDFTDAVEPTHYRPQKHYNNAISSSPSSVNVPSNPQRDLAYTPCVAQGWGGRNVELPKGLYVPKEISLSSYAAPPSQYTGHHTHFEPTSHGSLLRPLPRTNFSANTSSIGNNGIAEFPLSKPVSSGFSTVPPKQQLYPPSSYQKIPIGSENFTPQVNFSPTPLSVDKLARYEQPDRKNLAGSISPYLSVQQNLQVRNASPTPFGIGLNEHTSGSPSSIGSIESHHRQLLPTGSPRCGPLTTSSVSPPANKGQTFNKCARGWGAILDKQQTYQSQYSPPVVGNLPYSDF